VTGGNCENTKLVKELKKKENYLGDLGTNWEKILK
jgi:hypothetical protein